MIPGNEVNTDAEFEATIRRNGISNLHPVGTCRMGGDRGAVLRPAAAGARHRPVCASSTPSVMPSVPAGNTNAPTIMIAEKAADMILEDARAMA